MFIPVTEDISNSRGRYDFYYGVRYVTVEEEKIPNNIYDVQTAQASASASKAASGGDRWRNDNNNDDNKRKIIRDKDLSNSRPPNLVSLDAISLANRIQTDLETAVLNLVLHYHNETNVVNLCVAGEVGLNLVCDGQLVREVMFEDVFLPPYSGDDGIAVGCCAYGLFGNRYDASSSASLASSILLGADHEDKDRNELYNGNANDKDKDANSVTTTMVIAMTTTKKG